MKRIIHIFVFTLLSSATVNCYADSNEENNGISIPETKISLVQAIAIAEQSVPGRASSADLEMHEGQWVFEVEIVDGIKIMPVKIDSESGQILAAADDNDDNDDDNDDDDDDNDDEESEDEHEKHD